MESEKSKMLAGQLYDAADPQLVQERLHARRLIKELNEVREDLHEAYHSILKKLIPHCGPGSFIQVPFFCDYGYNIHIGEKVFFNFNCVILDVAKVTIGNRTLLGPNVQIYTATHPMDSVERASGLESGKPILIGDDVWIGGSVVVCPGVSIGDRTVIGAGSVVTRDIPSGVFAAGNPCRVIREVS